MTQLRNIAEKMDRQENAAFWYVEMKVRSMKKGVISPSRLAHRSRKLVHSLQTCINEHAETKKKEGDLVDFHKAGHMD